MFKGMHTDQFHVCTCTCTCSPHVAGLQSVLAVDTALTIDRTPPIPGRVYDGHTPGVEFQFQEQMDLLCVTWAGFSDPDTGVARIEWSIGRCGLCVTWAEFSDPDIGGIIVHSFGSIRDGVCIIAIFVAMSSLLV